MRELHYNPRTGKLSVCKATNSENCPFHIYCHTVEKGIEKLKTYSDFLNEMEQYSHFEDEDIKNVLNDKNLSNDEKINLIAEFGFHKCDVSRSMYLAEKDIKKFEVGEKVSNLGRHWQDSTSSESSEFIANKIDPNSKKVIFFCDNVPSYKVPYITEDDVFDKVDDEEVAESICNTLENEEHSYKKLQNVIGFDPDMSDEAEVIVSNRQEFEVTSNIYDEELNTYFINLKVHKQKK